MLMDVLDKTKFQGPLAIDQSPHGCFDQDELSKTFWYRPNVSVDILERPNIH